MGTTNLEILLKQTLSEEVTPSLTLDMETQNKMRKVVQRQESYLVTLLSILSTGFLLVGMIIILPNIQISSLKITYIILNTNIFTLFIFFLIVNYKNRKEIIL